MKRKDPRGRKTVKDKVVTLSVCVKTSVIKANGGPKKSRQKAKEWLESIIETDK